MRTEIEKILANYIIFLCVQNVNVSVREAATIQKKKRAHVLTIFVAGGYCFNKVYLFVFLMLII